MLRLMLTTARIEQKGLRLTRKLEMEEGTMNKATVNRTVTCLAGRRYEENDAFLTSLVSL